MADLLIPLLLVFFIVGAVLVAALVHQLRDIDSGPSQSTGGWRDGGQDPVPPWQALRERRDSRERRPAPSSRQPQRAQRPPAGAGAGAGRPLLPWQQDRQEAPPPRPAPAARRPAATPD